MTDRLTIVNWCHDPADACDPCAAHWVPNGIMLPLISDPDHSDDGSIDQVASFTGAPFWGIGMIADPVGPPGALVSGYIDIEVFAHLAGIGVVAPPVIPMAFTGPLPVTYEGSTVFSFDPATGVFSGSYGSGGFFLFDASATSAWVFIASGISRLHFSNCVMLDATKDHIVSPYNCVLPYTGPIPAIITSISPSFETSLSTTPVLFTTTYTSVGLGPLIPDPNPTHWKYTSQSSSLTPPIVYLHVRRAIDPV